MHSSQQHHLKKCQKQQKQDLPQSLHVPGSREKLGSHIEGGEVWLSLGHGASKCASCVPTVAVLWDWGGTELGRLRRARVKPPARFTGVSSRMWAVCTAEPRCCQRAPHRPLRGPARKRMAFLEGLRFFSPTPLWILLCEERECLSIMGYSACFSLFWLSVLWIIWQSEV